MTRAGLGWRLLGVLSCVLAPSLARSEARPADAGTLTHLALLRRLTEEAVGEMLRDLPIEAETPVLVKPRGAHAGNGFIADAIAASLTRSGHVVKVSDAAFEPAPVAAVAARPASADSGGAATDSSGALLQHLMALPGSVSAVGTREASEESAAQTEEFEGTTLLFGVTQFGVRYVGEGRPFLFAPKRVDRVAAVDVTCRLLDGVTGELQGVGHGDAMALDQISKGKLSIYESDGFSPKLEGGAGSMRFVEPVVVGGILAGLVYLFYTNQN